MKNKDSPREVIFHDGSGAFLNHLYCLFTILSFFYLSALLFFLLSVFHLSHFTFIAFYLYSVFFLPLFYFILSLSLFTEIRQAQMSRRLVLPLVAHAGYDEHDDGDDVG